MEHIKLALQGYNFGNGYISWAKTKYGGYSYANAVEFSTQQAQRLGWDSYGEYPISGSCSRDTIRMGEPLLPEVIRRLLRLP